MALLKKRNTESEAGSPVGDEPVAASARAGGDSAENARVTAGKGRPTPKRAQARAARPRGGAGAVRAATGKEGRRLQRAERREQSQQYRSAMMSGDVNKLPPRERAPERVIARDFVDTRFNIGPVFLAVALVYFIGGLVPNSYVRLTATYLMLVGIIAVVVDSIVLARQVSRRVAEKYPDSRVKVRAYSAQRALLPRRWRMPRPRVSRSDR
ncbi:DUF3043 domain-containing protein [Parafrankia sp. EUN1f]|uniref:DUF3043 domain-containing protein n=1 Tax=Parafrankia sp. EUN1f TaxID=102897 RepID=UPI0001C47056|nr:DUF3043 domain-containing protein [Parafrankia sp. EUN1f]EFC80439.1 hypothetical protein FrEUN1fDRAFT_6450 [Parafrankia sp. EUN1f]